MDKFKFFVKSVDFHTFFIIINTHFKIVLTNRQIGIVIYEKSNTKFMNCHEPISSCNNKELGKTYKRLDCKNNRGKAPLNFLKLGKDFFCDLARI